MPQTATALDQQAGAVVSARTSTSSPSNLKRNLIMLNNNACRHMVSDLYNAR